MAITFVGCNVGTATNGGNVTHSATVLLDSGGSTVSAAVGDLLVVASTTFGRAGNEGRIGNALSYTQDVDTTPGTQRFRVAYKIYVSGENSVVAEGSGNAADAMASVIFCFRGVDTSTPLDVATTTANATSTNPDPPAITPTNNNCAILVFAGSAVNDGSVTKPTGYTDFGTAQSSISDSDTNSSTIAGAYKILSGGGGASENPGSWTAWTSGAWVAATMALRPSTSGATVKFRKTLSGLGTRTGSRQAGNF